MAEPLGIAASLIAILQLADTVLHLVDDAKSADEDQAKILQELTAIHGVLQLVKGKVNRPPYQWEDTWFETLRSLKDPLANFHSLLEDLQSKLASPTGSKNVWKRRVTWHFRKSNVYDMLSSIERYHSIFLLALQGDHMSRLIALNLLTDVDRYLSQLVKMSAI
jgi:hypothetical protein